MIEKEIKAIRDFKSGHNCSQVVLLAYANELGIAHRMALNIASGFGAGMGRLQETCGAVTGAFMVIGLHNGLKYCSNQDAKEVSYEIIQLFNKKFVEIHGSTLCGELLNCNLRTSEGKKYFLDHNLLEHTCIPCISTAINLLDELLHVETGDKRE
ncbi:MAG: C-GCAxxG-C-C family protein [bacterium]